MKVLIPLILLIITFSNCNKKCKITGGRYQFEISSTLFPALDTFDLGDTITIISEFNDQVYEAKTNRRYDLSNQTINHFLRIIKISCFPSNLKAISKFHIMSDSLLESQYLNFSSSESRVLIGDFSYFKGQYSVKYKIIPLDTGLFLSSHGVIFYGQFPDQCDDMENVFHVNLNNGHNNNINMLQTSPDEHYNTWILKKPYDRFHSGGGYAFYVK